ncbi:RrF2 family transcriptional regulator [Catalinimonas niigatensis]|uniref:RrF2 family transcriptional regulator n=1 Tax=Catalinimonas niigatensis TaxID=1397264 RepID=UPI002665D742|nr:Rrf2 family transcriptional regulator [Catalinimonas niigatensis]WPP50367.1 Rrf2 family transcriptional regulator [Catalinimonas niigatensis]
MLSKKAKYGINALVYLAKKYEQGPLLIGDIATHENIPKKFLEAILLDLKNVGILGSKKGRGGGYYLIKSPDEVNMADVVRLFDGAIAFLPCVTHRYYERCEECKDEKTCGIRSLFKEVRDQTVEMLKNNTLSDIIAREQAIIEQEDI